MVNRAGRTVLGIRNVVLIESCLSPNTPNGEQTISPHQFVYPREEAFSVPTGHLANGASRMASTLPHFALGSWDILDKLLCLGFGAVPMI